MIQWGPAILVIFSVFLGVVWNNKRIDDLRSDIGHRFDDFKLWSQAEFRRLDERIDRLTEPIARMEDQLAHPVAKP